MYHFHLFGQSFRQCGIWYYIWTRLGCMWIFVLHGKWKGISWTRGEKTFSFGQRIRGKHIELVSLERISGNNSLSSTLNPSQLPRIDDGNKKRLGMNVSMAILAKQKTKEESIKLLLFYTPSNSGDLRQTSSWERDTTLTGGKKLHSDDIKRKPCTQFLFAW